MTFTAKQILNAVVERVDCDKHRYEDMCKRCHYCGGFNQGVEAQASVEYRFKREELAAVIFKHEYPNHHWDTKGPGMTNAKERCKMFADAIISAGPTLLEVVKKEGA